MNRFPASPLAPAAFLKRAAPPLFACLNLACAPALAQSSGASRALSVTPSVAATVIYTETTGRANADDVREYVTRISPGLQLRSRSGRLVGSLDYSLAASFYSRNKDSRSVDNALTAAFALEAVPGFAFIDTRASITQQALSAYGQQDSADSPQVNDNRVEVLNLVVSPYLRGPLGSVGEYEIRLNAAATNGYRSVAADSTNTGGSISLNSRSAGSTFGWSLLAAQSRLDFRAGRATDSSRASAAITLAPDNDIKFTLRGGQETTDVGGFERRTYDNWGAGVRWTPTERTVVNLEGDRRYFGSGHQMGLEHRLRRAVFRYASSRSASSGSDATGVGLPATLYQLYFARFASEQPDPFLRDQLVRNFLRAIGQDPNAKVSGGFVTSAVTLQRRDDLSMVMTGKRTSVSLQAFASWSQIIDNPTGLPDEGAVRQRGLVATISHRITPQGTLNLVASMQKTLANLRQEGTQLQSLSIGWNGVISTQATANLGTRFSVFDSPTDSYRESAVTASLSLRF